MTPARAKELLPVIQAFAEGKQIEYAPISDPNCWRPANEPTWIDTVRYRIKSEPREFWIGIDTAGRPQWSWTEKPEIMPFGTPTIIHVREVEETK